MSPKEKADRWAATFLGESIPGRTVTLAGRIAELVEKHGSLRAAGRVVSIDPGYLSRLASGEKAAPTKPYLTKLGLRRVVTYERIKP